MVYGESVDDFVLGRVSFVFCCCVWLCVRVVVDFRGFLGVKFGFVVCVNLLSVGVCA